MSVDVAIESLRSHEVPKVGNLPKQNHILKSLLSPLTAVRRAESKANHLMDALGDVVSERWGLRTSMAVV